MVLRDYRAYWSELRGSHAFHPGNQFRYKLIAGELKRLNLTPKTVIDCGCGDGSLIHTLRDLYPGACFSGLDVADNVPASRPGNEIQFIAANLGAPGAQDLHNRFDLVTCSEVIEHIENDDEVLRNLVAFAKPGGYMVLTTQSGRMYRAEQFLGHIRHYRLNDLRDRWAAAGAEIQKAYLCGWPFLNAQKVTAHYLFRSVQKYVIEPAEPSVSVRLFMAVLSRIYQCASRSHGPQIVIVARKPTA